MKNKRILQIGLGAAIILVLIYVVSALTDDTRNFLRVDTSVAMEQLAAQNVDEAQIDDREQRLRLELTEPITVEEREDVDQIITQYPARTADQIFDAVEGSNANSYTTNVTQDSFLLSMLGFLLPMLILFGLLFFFITRMQTGRGGMFGIGGNKAKQLTKDMPTNTFEDVAGADDAVDELQEVVDFLQDAERYEELGAKIPKGVLLYGPPGTGKTLIARAVAGEAGVPFYTISGSDFVEMFVGVGASRVRDMFKQARENKPCIIFVDEIDAVGRQRGSGMGGGHDEREQTLNQLLVEMDGFGDREGIILIAATNRPDILDQALLRPGRFDRQIPITAPDLKGRQQILKVHARGKPMAEDADLDALAKRTAGMSGADLENVINEAALLTARVGGNVITADALEEASDRVIGGPRRSSKVISEQEKKVTAYHEGGHTLAAWAIKEIERIYKVTILPRGRTGGHAMTAQEDDKGMYNISELFARLVFAMGGRAAEEVVFGLPTTGASADIEQATKIARAMVTEYGMSPALGPVKYGEAQGDPFSGGGQGAQLDYSPEVAERIDEQVAYLLRLAHKRAYDTLARYRDHLDRLAERLLEKETLRRPDLEELFDDIVPEEVGDIYPDEIEEFPRQAGREPVKTPTEIAIERGEEPPKRFSLLDASRQARERRRQELEQRDKGGDSHGDKPGKAHSGAHRPASHGLPHYEGTPPPKNWHVPGWPDNENPNPYAEHPGMRNYPGAKDAEDAEGDHSDERPSDRPTQQFGFRLPEHERPTRSADSDEEEAPGMLDDVPEAEPGQAGQEGRPDDRP
ncbi:cell division protein FtsH [Corynebacterium yudongzhengii]|uniref:ATP-dependent zinc metalloprotease FtsH n=1 Tax=Corynebacterium yudongzhengii TaxID=2080740 RepID=A0A2U1T5V8_9CORY|nr:ATP-dependent zinc metalloprotease FtsH [Corynebacterium yudongzhengii]AWB82648.1 cell division protein FtsH [Corynebacterium yudongzhengii]PWC01387.1 ATP-dependent zinc metalloprotease FtsH [Corynebacterium yudongzhengii]